MPSCSFSGCLCCIITIWVYLEFLSLKREAHGLSRMGIIKKIAHHTQRAIAGQKKKESRPLISSARRRSGKRRARIQAAKIEGKKVRRAFFCCYPCDDIVPESSLLLFAGKKFFFASAWSLVIREVQSCFSICARPCK